MASKRVSIRYARAVYNAAVETNFEEQVLKDFDFVTTVVKSSKDLRVVLNSPIIQSWKKKSVFKEIFSDKISALAFNFIDLVTGKGRESLLLNIFDEYRKIYNSARGILIVDITSATELNDDSKSKLLSKLKEITGKEVVSNYQLLPSIKGGLMVKIDDWVFDNSVQTQLNQLYTKLKSGN
jgi:F-type H+-transporting ATPase subunit delta